MNTNLRLVLILAACLAAAGCGAGSRPIPKTTLPSGRQISVLSLNKAFFSKDSPALWLKYQTDISLDDLPALQTEVNDVWESFRSDVEKAGLVNAMITAQEPLKGGIIKKGRMYTFVFRKQNDGTWKQSEKK